MNPTRYVWLARSALVLGFGLAACGGGPGQPASSAQAAQAQPAGASPEAVTPALGDTVQVKQCSADATAAADGLLDDFEDNDSAALEQGGRSDHYWWTGKDDKGSSIEPADFNGKLANGGAGGSGKALHVRGKTASTDGAWGAVVGLGLAKNKVMYDASKYAGVSFMIKGGASGTKTIRFKIPDENSHPDGGVCKDGCWNAFGKDVSLTPEWQEVKVLFADMRQSEGWGDPRPPTITPSKINSIEWSIDKGQEFEFWIDDVRFLDCP